MTLHEQIAQIAQAADFGTATAAKRGRNPKYPYVPVVDHGAGRWTRTTQIRGLAYVTRVEAVDAAQRQIDTERESLVKRLSSPRHRALREQYGLPREINP